MRRLLLLLLAFVPALAAGTNASAYPWPIKPFHEQHPIRANFGDPRTRFWNTMLTDGLQGPGLFQFHNGIDIAATEGTPVYPVLSGTASLIDGAAVLVRSPGHKFQYFHIKPAVHDGQYVVASRTVLGRVIPAVNHVHLTEIRGRRVWNPLARGGIAPYVDRTAPQIDAIFARPLGSLVSIDSATLWPAADFRTTLPLVRNFWNVYARGSYQNAPRFSNQQFFMPGRFLYDLAGTFDSRSYPNGTYEVRVHVSDMRGNWSDGVQQFHVENHPGEPCVKA
ncbi:MAG: hypothetical protein AUG91_09245 [Actinobacteria bacterium 13_1_20CM_4_69_9]|nr:MAG: hypothetical protein AUG91_09245 [Actinobacteria bacterium 13_1_20CM_4_69_9]